MDPIFDRRGKPAIVDKKYKLCFSRIFTYYLASGKTNYVNLRLFYAKSSRKGSGVCCVNGAAARKTAPGHKIILAAYVELEEEEIQRHEPYVVLLGEGNRIRSQSRVIIAGTRVT